MRDVKDTSAAAHAVNNHQHKRDRVLNYVREHQPVTRREISKALGIETATISGLVKPLMNQGALIETGRRKCSVTGNWVYQLEAAAVQLDWVA